MTNRTKRETVVDYGLYKIIIETTHDDKVSMFIEIGYHLAGLYFKININRFWHDVAEWRALSITK